MKSFFVDLRNLLFPPRCLYCNDITTEMGGLCATCWCKIDFISGARCKRCGVSFSCDYDAQLLCGACIGAPPLYSQAFAVFRHDSASKGLIHKFKYQDKTYLAPYFAKWMVRVGGELLLKADLIVPVPMHKWRLLSRMYNQAILLAQFVGLEAGKRVETNVLQRCLFTKYQFGLSRNQRVQNVHNAFVVNHKFHKLLSGKRVLLVDDVMTTGATINACVKALLEAKVASVDVIVLARRGLD